MLLARVETNAPSRLKIEPLAALLLVLLFLAWQLPGVVARQPWKSDEAYTVGLVHHMAQSGDLVVPYLAGEPFMQKPPVFFITATGFVKALSPMLEEQVAARGATLLFNALTLVFIGLASRELNGAGKGWPAAVMFLACIGPLHMAHFVLTDLAMLTGIALGLYGMAVGLRRDWVGGLICGTGAGLAFMAKGLPGPGLLGLTVLVLPLFDKTWRRMGWVRFTLGCVIASLPWVIIWPLALWLRSPALFTEWIIDNNFGRFITIPGHDVHGPHDMRGYMFLLLPWYAFPASVFALWTFWKERKAALASPGVRIPLIHLGVGLFIFTASRDGRELYAMPLVLPLLILGARCLDDIKPATAKRLHTAIYAWFSLAALIAWALWVGMLAGWPPFILAQIRVILPDFVPFFNTGGFVAGLLLTLGWLSLLLLPECKPKLLPVNMAAGLALIYGFGMTLFLPLAEWQMSYRRQFLPLKSYLPPSDVRVLSKGLGEPQRAMLDFYAGLNTLRVLKGKKAQGDWMLTESEFPNDRHNPGPDWERVWQDRHEGEWFQLFRRKK
jgi:4-amino-4-deoxy-L-arabinose transferase-like glycosyltransferase